jgi:hypothetical protein
MEKLSAKIITELVVSNMVSGFEEFKYSTLAPSRFKVFLHPQDFDYFRPVFTRLTNETRRALSEELTKRNKSWLKKTPRYEVEGGDWSIEYFEDPDRIQEVGVVEVESDLAQPERESHEGGRETIRVTTRGNSAGKTTIRGIVNEPAALATVTYEDDAGRHVFPILKEITFIGRGQEPEIDIRLRLNTAKDVSRRHAWIRCDKENRAFYVKDFSTYGTTVNGHPIPKSIDDTSGTPRDREIEFPLPKKARIGLAGLVFLDFEERQPL